MLLLDDTLQAKCTMNFSLKYERYELRQHCSVRSCIIEPNMFILHSLEVATQKLHAAYGQLINSMLATTQVCCLQNGLNALSR